MWLDTWGLTELQACSELKSERQDFKVEAASVSERYRMFGGIPRFVLQSTAMTIEDVMNELTPAQLEDLLSLRLLGTATPVSHQLLHARVRRLNYRTSHRDIRVRIAAEGRPWQAQCSVQCSAGSRYCVTSCCLGFIS